MAIRPMASVLRVPPSAASLTAWPPSSTRRSASRAARAVSMTRVTSATGIRSACASNVTVA